MKEEPQIETPYSYSAKQSGILSSSKRVFQVTPASYSTSQLPHKNISKKEMLGIVKNLFSKTDLDSSRTNQSQESPLLKYVKKKKHKSVFSTPAKYDTQSNPKQIVSPRKKPKKDVFSRFQQDLKMRRLRQSFYQNLRDHVKTYDNHTNTVALNEPTQGQNLLTENEKMNLLKRSHKRRKFVNVKDQCAIVSSPDRSILRNKVAKSQENFCKWRVMSTNFYNAYGDFDLENKDEEEGGGPINLLETYKQMKRDPKSLDISDSEAKLYGLSKDKKEQWIQPYPGCWRTVEQLKQGDVEEEQNPVLIRKVGKYKVPGVI